MASIKSETMGMTRVAILASRNLLDTKVITDPVGPFTNLLSTVLVNTTRVRTGNSSHELIHVVVPHRHAEIVDCSIAVGFLLLEQGSNIVGKLVLFGMVFYKHTHVVVVFLVMTA